jgi:glycerophosphoryl diester phosphodiesterase
LSAAADVVELDVQRGPRGSVEVRHGDRLGPLPLLWDDGRLRPAWPRLLLSDLLAAADEVPAALMLDVKGVDVRLAVRIRAALEHRPHREVLVCGRHWPSLALIGGAPGVRVLLSAGNTDELSRLRRVCHEGGLVGGIRILGASVEKGLLTRALLAELHDVLPVTVAWTVGSVADADRLLRIGVRGITTDSLEVLQHVRSAKESLLP